MPGQNLIVKIVDEATGRTLLHSTLAPKEFSSGSCGYFVNGSLLLDSVRDNVTCKHSVGINVVEAHSKEWAGKRPSGPEGLTEAELEDMLRDASEALARIRAARES